MFGGTEHKGGKRRRLPLLLSPCLYSIHPLANCERTTLGERGDKTKRRGRGRGGKGIGLLSFRSFVGRERIEGRGRATTATAQSPSLLPSSPLSVRGGVSKGGLLLPPPSLFPLSFQ